MGPAPTTNTSRRRAFTLLETVLAAAIGSIVVSACLGIFVMIERTDRLLETRARDQAELERLRLVMSRTFSSLLLSDAPRPVAEDPEGGSDNAAARARIAARRGARFDPKAPPPAERLALALDSAISLGMAVHGPGEREVQTISPQRLEVVLFESPVPSARELSLRAEEALARAGIRLEERASQAPAPGGASGDPSSEGAGSKAPATKSAAKTSAPATQAAAPSLDAEPGSTADAAQEAADLVETVATPVRAVRGVFELRPQRSRAPAQGLVSQDEFVEASAPLAWEMWWTPLHARASSSPEQVAVPSGPPFLVASNLRYARWRFFDDRQRKDAMSATWTQQLPAYVELEVLTTAGLMANWMFEVDWAIGPEVAPAPAAPAAVEDRDSPTDQPPDGDPAPASDRTVKGKEGKK